MNLQQSLIGFLSMFALCNTVLAAEGIVTITAQGTGGSNEVQVAAGQYFTFVGGYDNCGNTELLVLKDSKTFHYQPTTASGKIAGPAVVRLAMSPSANESCLSLATLGIEPAAYPPDKSLVVGPNSGNVQVTMEMSADLVNWTPAVNAMVYTNSPDARFFRIKLDKNVSP